MSLNFSNLEIALFTSGIFFLGLQMLILLRTFLRPIRYQKKIKKNKRPYSHTLPSVSVIIYAQDESYYLEENLSHILNQDYPNFEVIVVNDGSTEECKNVILRYKNEYSNLYQTFVPSEARNVSHKKLALFLGAKAAQNEIIILTEANCKPNSPQWLQNMCRNFLPEVDIVIGHTNFHTKKMMGSWYRKCDRISFIALYFSYAMKGKAFMGEGSNIAYRKKMFLTSRNFSRYLNLHFGDDDLFVNENATSTNVRTELSPESHIISYHDREKRAWKKKKLQYMFTNQYLRTGAKALIKLDFGSRYLFYFSVGTLVYFSSHNILLLPIAVLLLLIKAGTSILVYHKLKKIFNTNPHLCWLPLYNIIQYPVDTYLRCASRRYKDKFTTCKIEN